MKDSNIDLTPMFLIIWATAFLWGFLTHLESIATSLNKLVKIEESKNDTAK